MHFQWMVTPDKVKVHLTQTGFASHLVEDNIIHLCNITLDATPYRFGLPIDAYLPRIRQGQRVAHIHQEQTKIPKYHGIHRLARPNNPTRSGSIPLILFSIFQTVTQSPQRCTLCASLHPFHNQLWLYLLIQSNGTTLHIYVVPPPL